MPPKKSPTSAECHTYLRIGFSGSPEQVERDIAAMRCLLTVAMSVKGSLPSAGDLHYIFADSTGKPNNNIGRLAGISGTATAALLSAVQNAKGPIDLDELFAHGQFDDPEPITPALKEMLKNLDEIKKLLWKKRKKRSK